MAGDRHPTVHRPHGERTDELARTVRGVDPAPGSVPAQVHATGRSVVLARADDTGVLGTAPDGTPLLMLLGAASLLIVPISDGVTGYGVLTLARQAAEGRFTLADLALATELGEHLGVAIRVDRMFYSDGVTEARSPDMEYFEDRLADELAGAAGHSAAETTRMIQGLVASFSADDLRDDMTILVARVRAGD